MRDLSVEEARALAVDLIAATARTTAVVPAPGGIGGPIDVVLVGKRARSICNGSHPENSVSLSVQTLYRIALADEVLERIAYCDVGEAPKRGSKT